MEAYYIVNTLNISPADLDKADELIHSFLIEFQNLYGEERMTYNIHLLSHYIECVRRNGPLPLYTNYPMEDNIGHLVGVVKGTTDVVAQCCTKCLMERGLLKRLTVSMTLTIKYLYCTIIFYLLTINCPSIKYSSALTSPETCPFYLGFILQHQSPCL